MRHTTITRRGFLGLGAAAASAVTLPATGSAAAALLPGSGTAPLVDPYGGAIPMTFPLVEGAYTNPVGSGWHAAREGRTYAWNHSDGGGARAHDGVDTYPSPGVLPAVFAPVAGTVAAVCVRETNALGAAVAYAVSDATPPPWNYSRATDDIAHLPLYGNFVWIRSTDPGSRGYFFLLCHLQNEPAIRSLAPDQKVSVQDQLGVVGDTGNAQGTPQLHTEIHYPVGSNFPCNRCNPLRTLTSVNPEPSLRGAAPRPPTPA